MWRGLLLLSSGGAIHRLAVPPESAPGDAEPTGGGVRARRGRIRGIHGWSWLPVDIAPLVVKELRYLTRTLDHLMGLGMGLVGLVWILYKPEHLIYVLPWA